MSGINVIVFAVWVVSGLCVLDAVRIPMSTWAAADRQKGYWVSMLAVGGFVLMFAPVLVPAYLFGVRPRLTSALRDTSGATFSR